MLGIWLRMSSFVNAGGFTIPSSEADYNANGTIGDAVYPTHGGILQADGSWQQNAGVLGNSFSLSLPATATARGQLYMPGVNCDSIGVQTVLDSPALMQTAANNLLTLAQASRFDSPWDGVALDLENILMSYRDRLTTFITRICIVFHDAGLPVLFSANAKRVDGSDWVPGSSRYTYDFPACAAVADYFDMRCYGYPGPDFVVNQRLDYMGPSFWIDDSIRYSLGVGVPANKLLVGAGMSSRYWPVKGVHGSSWCTHADAAALVAAVPTYTTWVETDINGIIREQYADLGADQVWMHDHNAIAHPLGLATDYGLLGCDVFTPGMGTAAMWTTFTDWLTAATWHGYVSVENLNLAAGDFTAFLAIAEGQGRLNDVMPATTTHIRSVSTDHHVVEAAWRYGEMTQDQCTEWLAAVLDVDPAGVTCSVAGDVWTLTHGGTDYVDLTLYGGEGSTWEVSGAACRAAL